MEYSSKLEYLIRTVVRQRESVKDTTFTRDSISPFLLDITEGLIANKLAEITNSGVIKILDQDWRTRDINIPTSISLLNNTAFWNVNGAAHRNGDGVIRVHNGMIEWGKYDLIHRTAGPARMVEKDNLFSPRKPVAKTGYFLFNKALTETEFNTIKKMVTEQGFTYEIAFLLVLNGLADSDLPSGLPFKWYTAALGKLEFIDIIKNWFNNKDYYDRNIGKYTLEGIETYV